MQNNYYREMEKIIAEIKKQKVKPSLLLHACCAPCSSTCIERLKDFFNITVYYYNPNIDSLSEYEKRSAEEERFCAKMGVKYLKQGYEPQCFYDAVTGHEEDKEGGARCAICFKLRLSQSALIAKDLGYDYFTTTLTLSPLKNAEVINKIGEQEAQKTGVKFLPSDFKKKNGYLRSIELSKEYSLYRQNYCGCKFSKNILP